jgi:hypothetical protein
MSQRHSGWKRESLDRYETPSWVTNALIPHLPKRSHLWEPAAGGDKMVHVLAAAGYIVNRSDIATGTDFLQVKTAPHGVLGIVTNPPFDQAQAFIEHAIGLMESVDGFVAMLLRIDFDSASTRQHLFGNCPIFSRKIILTKRIVWFEGTKGHPSFNHCWCIWDHRHRGPPELRYAPVAANDDDQASTWRKPYVAREAMQ